MRDIKNAYRIVTEKREGERPFGTSRHRWEDNIGLDIRKM
jgi:hypothetical protein